MLWEIVIDIFVSVFPRSMGLSQMLPLREVRRHYTCVGNYQKETGVLEEKLKSDYSGEKLFSSLRKEIFLVLNVLSCGATSVFAEPFC